MDVNVKYDVEKGIDLPDGFASDLGTLDVTGWEKEQLEPLVKEISRVLAYSGTTTVSTSTQINDMLTKSNLKYTWGGDDGNLTYNIQKSPKTLEITAKEATKTIMPKVYVKSMEERIVYYPVHTPYMLDDDNHYFTYEALEKACERFELIRKNIDRWHNFQFLTDEVEVIDNFIAKGDEVYTNFDGEQVSPIKGQWIIGLTCKSDEIWEGVKDGTYSGVSMYGQGFFEKGDIEEILYGNIG